MIVWCSWEEQTGGSKPIWYRSNCNFDAPILKYKILMVIFHILSWIIVFRSTLKDFNNGSSTLFLSAESLAVSHEAVTRSSATQVIWCTVVSLGANELDTMNR